MGVSSPCRHVTSVLTVLYNADTYAILLPTSESSSNSSVYANAPSSTYRHPHTVTHMASPVHLHRHSVTHALLAHAITHIP